MVSRPKAPSLALVLALVAALLACGWGGFASARQPEADPVDQAEAVEEVRRALSGRGYPWYDPRADDYRPVMPTRPPSPPRQWGNWSGFGLPAINLEDLGRLVIFVLLAAGLTALILYIARTWQRRIGSERTEAEVRSVRVAGTVARVGTLPAGLMVDETDPMEAARRYRERGDLGRALVLLFAHQLLMLDRMGVVRLAPGRTGRQLVRSIDDDVLRGAVGRTLRMFEASYYGHQPPEAEAFEALWAEAESLDAMMLSGAVR